MKNIHILPINLDNVFQKSNRYIINQNVYITSDLEIKEGDWVTDCEFDKMKLVLEEEGDLTNWKKIILTTDQDLIADGVQAIDDEFLEWFVKNPSCEFVEWDKNYNRGNEKYYYKIIIPQEEPEKLIGEKVMPLDNDNIEEEEETLEEAADNWVRKPVIGTKRESFIAGANWQAERMYTYDEMRTIAYNAYCLGQIDSPTEGKFNEWIQQFKKI